MRTINIILMELSVDKLKAEDKLEKLVNSTVDISEKTKEIKSVLREIVLIDEMTKKWQDYMPGEEPKNNNN
jgi:hypothetical protein